MYVGDLVLSSNTTEEVEATKQKFFELFRKSRFNLHTWHSNIPSNIKPESELT